MAILDSGERREFDSGAVRDIQEGKGRCDLLPLDIIYIVTGDVCFNYLDKFIKTGEYSYLIKTFNHYIEHHLNGYYTALLEVSIHYEEGCKKYGKRNWEKGIPLHCFIDSGVRHYIKFLRGDKDERHDRAFLWNMLGALWTLRNKPELNDLPFATKDDNDEV